MNNKHTIPPPTLCHTLNVWSADHIMYAVYYVGTGWLHLLPIGMPVLKLVTIQVAILRFSPSSATCLTDYRVIWHKSSSPLHCAKLISPYPVFSVAKILKIAKFANCFVPQCKTLAQLWWNLVCLCRFAVSTSVSNLGCFRILWCCCKGGWHHDRQSYTAQPQLLVSVTVSTIDHTSVNILFPHVKLLVPPGIKEI